MRPDGGDASGEVPIGSEICRNGIDDDGDRLVDCNDPDCGLASCNDGNECTTDTCVASLCRNEANTASCGPGCLCAAGIRTEIYCIDGIDNDRDGAIDCQDADCPCEWGVTCCSGTCRFSCSSPGDGGR